jgi:hypothetical protein
MAEDGGKSVSAKRVHVMTMSTDNTLVVVDSFNRNIR